MTLRATIEIVPYGDESQKEELFRIDVSNTGLVRNERFGHEICSYSVKVFRRNNETMQRLLKAPEWELEKSAELPEHDRRDGALELIRKAIKILEEDLTNA